IRNADTSFVYFARQDGVFAAVPAQDRIGRPHDFSQSATLQRAHQADLIGQGQHDGILGTAHLGILNSPDTWGIAFDFLTDPSPPALAARQLRRGIDPETPIRKTEGPPTPPAPAVFVAVGRGLMLSCYGSWVSLPAVTVTAMGAVYQRPSLPLARQTRSLTSMTRID